MSNQLPNIEKNSEEKKIPSEYVEVDISKLKSPVKNTHNWIQKGFNIICTSCEVPHGSFIGKDIVLCGIDKKGQPIFKKRKFR